MGHLLTELIFFHLILQLGGKYAIMGRESYDTALKIHLSSQQLPRVFIIISVFIVITSAKILLKWLFPRKIYIQFTIFNTVLTSRPNFRLQTRYHLHVLEKCLYMLQEFRSIYFWQFIHTLSLCWSGNKKSFAFT